MINCGFTKELNLAFEIVTEQVRDALKRKASVCRRAIERKFRCHKMRRTQNENIS
jgi:hypothetical protein